MTWSNLDNRTSMFWGSAVAYFLILLARSRESIAYLPSDPGYGYIYAASQDGVSALIQGDPYFHLVARLLAWIDSWFPLTAQAVVLAVMVHLVWTLSAVIIANVLWTETGSRVISVLVGLLLVIALHASESSLGNVGNVKWPLLAASLVLCSSAEYLAIRPRLTAIFIAATGLTNPLTVLCLIPLAMSWGSNTRHRRVILGMGILVAVVLSANIVKVGVGNAASGRNSKVTSPWADMGLFWWSGLMGPIAVSGASLVIALVLYRRKPQLCGLISRLAITAIVLPIASYQLGGIADRYFVAPLTISLIAASLCCLLFSQVTSRLFPLAVFALAVAVVIPSAKWFSSGWYMTSGTTWSDGVTSAKIACASNVQQVVALPLSPDNSEEVDCEYILRE